MPTTDEARAKAAATYNAAADSYDDPQNSFWARFGRSTIERLNLQPGNVFSMSAAVVELPPSRRQRKLDLMDLFSESISRKSCSRWHARKRTSSSFETLSFVSVTCWICDFPIRISMPLSAFRNFLRA